MAGVSQIEMAAVEHAQSNTSFSESSSVMDAASETREETVKLELSTDEALTDPLSGLEIPRGSSIGGVQGEAERADGLPMVAHPGPMVTLDEI